MVRWEGVEPPTLKFVAWCSIQLSYQRKLQHNAVWNQYDIIKLHCIEVAYFIEHYNLRQLFFLLSVQFIFLSSIRQSNLENWNIQQNNGGERGIRTLGRG